jgi:hypothetical protein
MRLPGGRGCEPLTNRARAVYLVTYREAAQTIRERAPPPLTEAHSDCFARAPNQSSLSRDLFMFRPIRVGPTKQSGSRTILRAESLA